MKVNPFTYNAPWNCACTSALQHILMQGPHPSLALEGPYFLLEERNLHLSYSYPAYLWLKMPISRLWALNFDYLGVCIIVISFNKGWILQMKTLAFKTKVYAMGFQNLFQKSKATPWLDACFCHSSVEGDSSALMGGGTIGSKNYLGKEKPWCYILKYFLTASFSGG